MPFTKYWSAASSPTAALQHCVPWEGGKSPSQLSRAPLLHQSTTWVLIHNTPKKKKAKQNHGIFLHFTLKRKW